MTDELNDPIDRAVLLHAAALDAFGAAALDRAAAFAGESLALFEQESGPFHPDVANVLNCLARIHEQRADHAAAEAFGRRSVDIMRRVRQRASGEVRGAPHGQGSEKAAGDDIDRLYVQSLTGLGDVLRIRGRYDDAEPWLREAIALGETALGADDEDVVTAVNSLAVLFKYSGRFDDAAVLYARALAAAERSGASDESLATLLHNVGGLEHARGDYARGEPAARRSVELRERALGPDHPAVAADVAALAAIVDGLGRHDEAEAMYLRALATFERVYGPDHYEIAVNLNNLAGVRQAQGRLVDGEALYRRALTIKETLLGSEHPDVALTLNNLALLLDAMGKTSEAEPLYERALQILRARLDPRHPKVVACAKNYAGLLRDAGREADALAIEGRHGLSASGKIFE
jgi:tetratricopeptide (TPR) repeat protein